MTLDIPIYKADEIEDNYSSEPKILWGRSCIGFCGSLLIILFTGFMLFEIGLLIQEYVTSLIEGRDINQNLENILINVWLVASASCFFIVLFNAFFNRGNEK